MGRVRHLAAAARLSRRRMMKLRAPRTGDMLLYVWLVIVILIRFTLNCILAERELTRGSHSVGLAIAEFTMLHFLLVVFLLTFLSSTLSLGASGLDRKRLALLGVPFPSLVFAELSNIFTHPMTGVVFLFIIPGAVPLLALAHPGACVLSLLAAFLGALLLAFGLGHALSLNRTAHRLAGAFRFVFIIGLLGLLLSNFDFQWNGGPIRIFVFEHPILLLNDAGQGLLPVFRAWSPSVWIFRGWLLPCIGLAAAALVIFVFSLRGMYDAAGEAAPSRRARASRQPAAGQPVDGAPAGRGGISAVLYRHELKRLASAPGSIACMAAGIGSAAWLLAAEEPTLGITILGCILALLTTFSSPVNIFGHDGQALRRYALLCPRWSTVFWAMNRSWLTVMAGALIAPVAATAIRVSVTAAASLLLCIGLVLLVTLVWGNFSSLLLPFAHGALQGAAFINQIAPFAICGLPLAIHRMVAPFGSFGFDAALFMCIGAAGALLAVFLNRVSRTFDAEVESVLERF